MVTCKDIIQDYFRLISEEFECHSDGPYTVLSTPYFYSDGDFIELFLEQSEDRVLISDLGETARRMATFHFNWSTKQSRALFSQILNSTGVSSNRGKLYVVIGEKERLGARLLDLIHAVQQTDNLLVTMQKYSPQAFRDEVEGYLRKEGFEPELNYQLEGQSGNIWRVHFYINHGSNVIMKALSAASRGAAKYQVSTTYTAYDDIKKNHPQVVRSLIVDDTIQVWDQEIISLAKAVLDTEIGFWSKRDLFSQQLLSFKK